MRYNLELESQKGQQNKLLNDICEVLTVTANSSIHNIFFVIWESK